jgi:hypothetical protein
LLIQNKELNGNKKNLQGTGTLIKRNKHWYVLTVAHNLYCKKKICTTKKWSFILLEKARDTKAGFSKSIFQ